YGLPVPRVGPRDARWARLLGGAAPAAGPAGGGAAPAARAGDAPAAAGPLTLRELAGRFGLTVGGVRTAVAEGVARLLRAPAAHVSGGARVRRRPARGGRAWRTDGPRGPGGLSGRRAGRPRLRPGLLAGAGTQGGQPGRPAGGLPALRPGPGLDAGPGVRGRGQRP